MTRDELIEAMARAMCECQPGGCFVNDGGIFCHIHNDDAAAALAAIEAAGCVVVPRKLLTEAHACMRETGWHLANTCNYSGDGVLEAACSDVEARMAAILRRSHADDAAMRAQMAMQMEGDE